MALTVDGDERGPSAARRRQTIAAVLMVIAAALLWSTSGLVFRLIESANHWQVVFWRSGTLVPFVGIMILVRSRLRPLEMVRTVGWHGVAAGAFLASAFTFWILAISATTIANAVFVLCCAPIAAAILAWLFLGEKLTPPVVVAIFGVVIGVGIITAGAVEAGRSFGNLLALVTALSFAAFTVMLRLRSDADMLPSVLFAGVFSAAAGYVGAAGAVAVTKHDLLLCTILGVGQIGLGLVLYTSGARYLSAAQVSLLALIEVATAPLWVWIMMSERPTNETLVGGAVMLCAVGLLAFPQGRRAPGG